MDESSQYQRRTGYDSRTVLVYDVAMATKEIFAIVGSVVGSIVVILGTVIALDLRLANRIDALDNRIESRFGQLESRFGRLEMLLTENLIILNRDIGELKGQAHTHPSGTIARRP